MHAISVRLFCNASIVKNMHEKKTVGGWPLKIILQGYNFDTCTPSGLVKEDV
jgi:hypothetical protein